MVWGDKFIITPSEFWPEKVPNVAPILCTFTLHHHSYKENASKICSLCGSIQTKELKIAQHQRSRKHINNVITYNDTIKKTLEKKKSGDDMINKIMSYL